MYIETKILKQALKSKELMEKFIELSAMSLVAEIMKGVLKCNTKKH